MVEACTAVWWPRERKSEMDITSGMLDKEFLD